MNLAESLNSPLLELIRNMVFIPSGTFDMGSSNDERTRDGIISVQVNESATKILRHKRNLGDLNIHATERSVSAIQIHIHSLAFDGQEFYIHRLKWSRW